MLSRYLLVKNLRTRRIHIVESRFAKYLTTECGYDGIDFPKQESFSVFKDELDGKITCKTCRKVLGLAALPITKKPDSGLVILLKDSLRLMRKSGGFIKRAPIFERLERAIEIRR